MNEKTPGDRLKQAREQKMKFTTASQAARFLNVATPTYLSHENGTRKISAEWADRYAEGFGISPTWLLYNRGALDAENTFVRPVANTTAQRNPAMTQSGNPLLAIFEVNYAPDGALRPLPGVRNIDAPAWLPTVSAANGFIAELVHAPVPERESRRIVQIVGVDPGLSDGSSVLFGLDDFIRLPPDMLPCDMAFAVRLRTADLIESASGYDRAIIDPGDRVPFRAAYYYVLINKKASIVYMMPSDDGADWGASHPERVLIYETRFEDPKVWPFNAIVVIGRVILMIMTMSEQLKADFIKPLELAQQRRGPALAARAAPSAGLPPPRSPLRQP